MCGYCTEIYALASAAEIALPAERQMVWQTILYLQESSDIESVLRGAAPSATGRPEVARVLMARAIEYLMDGGFNSLRYQALLATPGFEGTVRVGCEPGLRGAVSITGAPLDARRFGWLHECDTYLEADAFEKRLQTTRGTVGLLRQYEAWWLEGGRVAWSNRSYITGEEPALESAESADRTLFDRSFLPIWLAVCLASKGAGNSASLWPIARKSPAGVPHSAALDLWLQRRAALSFFDDRGIAPFAAAIDGIRGRIFQYLALKGRISQQDRQVLKALQPEQRPGLESGADYFSMVTWLIEGDVYQGLRGQGGS